MPKLKLTSWNIEHLDELSKSNLNSNQSIRKNAIVEQIQLMNPDILCLQEGPALENIDTFSNYFGGDYQVVKATDIKYDIRGTQWIWFLVKSEFFNQCSLLPIDTYNEFAGGKRWKVHYWGDFKEVSHGHYRQPQTLILNLNGQRIEFIGVHLKSKFVNGGKADWEAEGTKREKFIREAIKARIKLTTEANQIRSYIDTKFKQLEHPAIFVLGDMNDGPGKEYFEQKYLHFDLINNIQGDIFKASQFLNHSLFDYSESLRWSYEVKDFVTEKDEKILIDHILFTQSLVNWKLPTVCVEPNAGKVEHEVHDLINSSLNKNQKTSDHKPVSLEISYKNVPIA